MFQNICNLVNLVSANTGDKIELEFQMCSTLECWMRRDHTEPFWSLHPLFLIFVCLPLIRTPCVTDMAVLFIWRCTWKQKQPVWHKCTSRFILAGLIHLLFLQARKGLDVIGGIGLVITFIFNLCFKSKGKPEFVVLLVFICNKYYLSFKNENILTTVTFFKKSKSAWEYFIHFKNNSFSFTIMRKTKKGMRK